MSRFSAFQWLHLRWEIGKKAIKDVNGVEHAPNCARVKRGEGRGGAGFEVG